MLWTGHYARIVERDGLRLIARGSDPAKDQSYMLATVDPALLDRVAFPLGGQGKRSTRDEAAAAGLAVAERAESQEACFLAGDDYRTFLERQGLARRPGPIVDEQGVELGRHDGVWRYTPGQRRGIGLAAPEPVYALRSDTATNTLDGGAAQRTRGAGGGCPGTPLPSCRAGRGEAALPIRGRACRRRAAPVTGSRSGSSSRPTPSHRARSPCSTTTTRSWEPASSSRQPGRIRPMTQLAFTAGDAAYWGLAIFLVAIGLASAFMLFRLGQTFERLSSFIKGTERDLLPVIVKTGATVDRVNYQLDKADTVTDSAVSMADSADTAVRAISTAIATPVEKVSGLAAGVTHGFSQFRKSKDFGEATAAAREAARQREADLHDDLRNAGRDADGDRAPSRPAAAGGTAEARPVAPPAARAEAGARTGSRPAGRAGGEARTGSRPTGRADRRVGRPGARSGQPGRRYDRVMRTTAELREGFLSYFESKGHLRRPSAPLDPAGRRPVDAVHRRRHAADEAVVSRRRRRRRRSASSPPRR